MTRALITGAAGYIGAHLQHALAKEGYETLGLDIADQSDAPHRLRHLRDHLQLRITQCDIRDPRALRTALKGFAPYFCCHLAARISVPESVAVPATYWHHNIEGTRVLLQVLHDTGCRHLQFASSASVYATTPAPLVDETAPCAPSSPYAETKLAAEWLLAAWAQAHPDWRIDILRYANPVGYDPSGRLNPHAPRQALGLIDAVRRVLERTQQQVQVTGYDYPTADGTAIRDYIHVQDIVAGHLAAVRANPSTPGVVTANLSSGVGTSVLQLLAALSDAVGAPIAYALAPRRPGDTAGTALSHQRAQHLWGWTPQRTTADIAGDLIAAWRTQGIG